MSQTMNEPREVNSGPERSYAVETADETESDKVIDTLVMAFSSDPLVRWLYPNPQDYLEYFPELLRIFGGKAFEHGTADYVEDFAGSALWLPPEVHPDDEALAELLENSVPEERVDTAQAAFEALDEYHPDEPHYHFAAVGVDPTRQNKGYGSALIEDRLAKCDEADVPVYLESTNP